jgi:hypothetical protein
MIRTQTFIAILLGLVAASARGQDPVTNAPVVVEEEADPGWAFSASAYTYFVPDDDDYIQPTFTLDRDWLHLEARYNYEAKDTASLWAGYNLSGGDELAWELTPMLGVAFGDLEGVAPGYKGSLSWWRLELYSEGEYLAGTEDSSDSFFYNWSELTFALTERCRFGIVTQRTQAYDSDRDIQRGLLAGLSLQRVDVTAYVFNPDDDPSWVFAVGLGF